VFTDFRSETLHLAEKSAIRTEVFQSFGWGSQGFSLIDAEEGPRRVCFPYRSKRRVTEHATFRLMRSKAPYQMNREEMKARRKWNSGCEWH
jgi:hypothetical protein